MKILICHNFYQQPGGEDRVFADETWLLESRGHKVQTFTVHNDSISDRSRLSVAADTIWNRRIARALHERVLNEQFDLVHFHNTFPLISPAAYRAVRKAGAAVVQTLHNFRFLCPQATFLRNGRVCTDCLEKRVPWPAVVHSCYRTDRLATATLCASLSFHRVFGTYQRAVDRYIALTEFSRQLFTKGGLPEAKIAVKPNFVCQPPEPGSGAGNYVLFVGRLSVEKGIQSLLAAWEQLDGSIPLRIAGNGPFADEVKAAEKKNPAIRWLGALSAAEVEQAMRDATCLILPSTWYEGLPKTLVESLAAGTPILASRLGALEELVEAGRTGEFFTAGQPEEIAATVRRFWNDPATQARMRIEARAEFDARYTAERNYELLMDIYQQALALPTTPRAELLEPQTTGGT